MKKEARSTVEPVAKEAGAGLGTFGGVFVPSVLTILGIILFLRLGWVVGSGGLRTALIIIALSHVVSVLTSVSLAAIATNRRIRGGGDYYLISRSLGLEFGGSLGTLLFLAQTVSAGFYCFGFGEALARLLPDVPYGNSRTFALGAAVVLSLIAFVGADLAARLQYIIMAVIVAALVAFFIGAGGAFSGEQLASSWVLESGELPFWTLFAIFFPAVTGFTQGVSMSGDLKDPGRSLPAGTFGAVGVSIVVYFVAAVAFAGAAPLEQLSADYFALMNLSAVPSLADAGVVAATLSSALASLMGAPRILQAMARDQIFPVIGPFGVGSGPAENPRRGVVLCAVIAITVIALGNLNAVASVISMFFLISYGLLNVATYVEARGASPSFRPRFRFFDHRLSLVGSVFCFGAMLAIDPFAGVAALAALGGLYRYLRRTERSVRWSDGRRVYYFRRLKEILREISRHPETEWTWQPNVIVLPEVPDRRDLLARFGTWLSGTSGVTTVVGVLQGEGGLETKIEQRQKLEDELRTELEEQRISAFPLAVVAPDLRVAVETVLQTWGIGPVRANTVLVDWYEHLPEGAQARDAQRYGRQLRSMIRLGCNVAVFDVTGREWRRVLQLEREELCIDIWWWENPSSRLALLFAYLVTRDERWEDARLRVLVPCDGGTEDRARKDIANLLEAARIDAEFVAVPDASSEKVVELSKESAVVFLPLTIDGMTVTDPFGGALEDLLEELPIVCLIAAAKDVRLRDHEVEEPTGGKEDPAE